MGFSWEKVSIMIVEDDNDMREVLHDLFHIRGSTVYSAKNGKEALEILQKNSVDLVFSDVQMPVMDGMELLRRLREIDPNKPKVLMSTGYAKVTEESAIAAGAKGLFLKPFDSKSLTNKIIQILSE